ncbi:MAG TPA: SLBB domain-containing protein, partial [Candidatus Cloacimonadota bacterium]|nr:SLBB domain-containing protein [Candidatus Cloacimonadota bacterium]
AVSKTVSIQGKINSPGDYEYIAGDKLGTLLELAQGLTPGADLARVILYRYTADKRNFETRILDLRGSDPATLALPLEEGDRIMIPEDSEYRRQWKVSVTGKVTAPGEYLIGEETTLYDLLAQCGGPSQRGDLSTAIYLSQTMNESVDPEFERLKTLSMGQMTPLEYNYLRAKLRQIRGKYAVDIQKIWDSKGSEGDLKLRDGDLIYVPEKLDMVWVSGQVRNPGLLPLEKGKNWKDYVKAAGGFTNNRRAGGIRIIRASSGNWVKATDKIELKSGDIIFIPEKTDRDVWVDVKDIFLVVSQLVTIFVGVRALTM